MCESTSNLVMPSKPVLVDETIARLDTSGVRSQLLRLDSQTLRDLGLMLTDRAVTVIDAWRWLNRDMGGSDEEPAVDAKAVYRLAEHFRRLYTQVRREHAARIARLNIEHATQGNLDAMHRVAKHRLVELAAEALVSADNLDDLRPTDIAAIINTVGAVDAGKVREAELKLKSDEAERRAAKLASDLATAEARRAEIRQTLSGLRDRIQALEAQVAKAQKAQATGKKIDPSIYTSIREELLAMAAQAQTGGVL